MNNNIVTKDKQQIESLKHKKEAIAKDMMEQLEIEAECREHELKVLDRLMRSRSEIDVSKCKGRD